MLGLGHMIPMTSALASGVPFESLMLKWRREYGPFFEFRLPGSPAVVLVADPEAIKEVCAMLPAPTERLLCCAGPAGWHVVRMAVPAWQELFNTQPEPAFVQHVFCVCTFECASCGVVLNALLAQQRPPS
jgi:cytochrome P450